MTHLGFIEPQWPAPPAVRALCTTREPGYSEGSYAGCNLALHVGDEPDAVMRNRELLNTELGLNSSIQWLQQEHGSHVMDADADRDLATADACYSIQPGRACAVLVADCLPVLMCSQDASVVASTHAGWRGLLAGVLEQTVAALPVAPGELLAWLGPAIGPHSFEVGPEVRQQFLEEASPAQVAKVACCFVAGTAERYLANLYSLARLRLAAAGVSRVYGGDHCSFRESSLFYSHRRDGTTGRMAGMIMIQGAS